MKRKMNKVSYPVLIFRIFMVFMAVYYGMRLFMITPWYDELYTYYYFISRGPAYAAVHWPLPNNHVGYSVISSLLMVTGNGYIALRGISYIAALVNLYLLFHIVSRGFSDMAALISVMFYAGLGSVMNLAVQGRGYTLATMCMLVMFTELQKIYEGPVQRRDYIVMGCGAVLGLYTVPSSLYWVITIFIAGGSIYIISGKKKEFRNTLICALISAAAVFALYSVIWLAVGSNILVKDTKSTYFGMKHISVIMKAFLPSWKTGLDYMLASPYIQSVSGDGFAGKLLSWILSEMTEMSGFNGIASLAVMILMIMFSNIYGFRRHGISRMTVIIADAGIIGSVIMMVLQLKLPYYRVFSFWGAFIAVFAAGTAACISEIIAAFHIKTALCSGNTDNIVIVVFAVLSFIFMLRALPFHEYQYGEREYMAYDALENTYTGTVESPAVTDCEQQYLLKFMYDRVCENTNVSSCDYVIFDKKLIDGSDSKWEYLTDHAGIDWDYVKEKMTRIYDNEDFIVYIAKQAEQGET